MFYTKPGNPPEEAQNRARRKVTPSPSLADCPPGFNRKAWARLKPHQRESELNAYLASLPEETQRALTVKYGLGMGRNERRAAYRRADNG